MRRFTSAHAISLAALFISIGGTAFAAATLGSGDIANNSLKSKDLKDGKAVQGIDIVDGSVAGTDITDGTLAGSDITDGSVGTTDLANDSINSTKVGDNTLTGNDVDESTLRAVPLASKLANVTTKREDFLVGDGTVNLQTATCPAGKQAISGGVRSDDADTDGYVVVSRPIIVDGPGPIDGEGLDGWRGVVYNQTDAQSGQAFGANTLQATVWAVCIG
jgi:hypothetical protein